MRILNIHLYETDLDVEIENSYGTYIIDIPRKEFIKLVKKYGLKDIEQRRKELTKAEKEFKEYKDEQ